jgi:hypothetical protein
MLFAAKNLKLDGREVRAWTALPEAYGWRARERMLDSGLLVEVPDELLLRSLRRNKKPTKDATK